MRCGRTIIGAGAAVAASALPVAIGTGVAHAGPGDDKSAAVTWDFTWNPPREPSVTCTLTAYAELKEYVGFARFGVDDTDTWCTPFLLDVVIRFTDRFGNPSTVRAVTFDPAQDSTVVAVADDVRENMVADVTAEYSPGGGAITTTRRLTPK
jgi:hypothetical protein